VPNAIPGPVFTADSQHQENPSSPEPTRHHSHAVAVATSHTSLYWYRGQQDVPEAADPVCRSAVIAGTTVSTCAVNSVPARSGDGGFVAARCAATRESLVPEPALPRRGCRALAGEHGWPRQPDQGDLDGMDLGPDPSVRCHSDRGVGHLRTVSATAASRALACSRSGRDASGPRCWTRSNSRRVRGCACRSTPATRNVTDCAAAESGQAHRRRARLRGPSSVVSPVHSFTA